MNFGVLAAPRYSYRLITVFFECTGSVLMNFAKRRINFNEEVFFRVGDQRLQDILENVISAPLTEFMINAIPVTEWANHATLLLKTISTKWH